MTAMRHYADDAFTPAVVEHQRHRGPAVADARRPSHQPPPTELDDDERRFLSERDSFYLSSVGENGWPYVQHRGGPPGFLKVLGPNRIAWAERPGNRQYVTAGHLDADDRVALIAVDYPTRQRLKLYGHARYLAEPTDEQIAELGDVGGRIDGIVHVDVVATAWNCPKHITPRYTAEQVRVATEPLTRRIAALEAELAALR